MRSSSRGVSSAVPLRRLIHSHCLRAAVQAASDANGLNSSTARAASSACEPIPLESCCPIVLFRLPPSSILPPERRALPNRAPQNISRTQQVKKVKLYFQRGTRNRMDYPIG